MGGPGAAGPAVIYRGAPLSVGVNLIVCNRTPAHRKATEFAVRSLLDSDLGEARLVAVDNGSTDDTAVWLTRQGFEVETLPQNVGIAPARNRATKKLLESREVATIVEMHNDMVFPRRWFVPLLEALAVNTKVGMASASLMTPRGTLGSPKVLVDYAERYEVVRGLVNRMAVGLACPHRVRAGLQHPVVKRADMLREIGLYDERFAWGNFEDTDEVYRAQQAGWKYVVVGGAVVWHAYTFSRLQLTDHPKSYRDNLKHFLAKWPDAQAFLKTYQAQTEAIYR